MSLFEVGKEYYLDFGTVEHSHTRKILVIDAKENWIKVNENGSEELLNTLSPLMLSAKEMTPIDKDSKFAPPAPPPGAI